MEEINNMPEYQFLHFRAMYSFTLLIGGLMCVLVCTWVSSHLGGLAWQSNPALEFNWHPILMIFGMIFIYGNSIMIYRGMRLTRKRTLKLLHAGLHFFAFIVTVIGLKAVFDSHNLASKPIPNLYSLHSWLGLLSVILFCGQYVVGFISFLVPGLRQPLREKIMPYHVVFGLLGFGLAAATSLLGFSEKIFFVLGPEYANHPNQGLFVNFIALVVVLFTSMVFYLTTQSEYRRQPLAEDAILLTGQNE